MKQLLLGCLLLSCFGRAGAQQSVNPGGVPGATHWYIADAAAALPSFRSHVEDTSLLLPLKDAGISQLNFYPTLVFKPTSQLIIPLSNLTNTGASYFTVYQSTDTTAENNIWHFTSNNKTSLVLTTSRMADFEDYNYMNFIDRVLQYPKVNVYIGYKPDQAHAPLKQTWLIGNKPLSPQLPIVPFNGLIPEVIAYDRVLTSRERLQVASYLALKYGITLTEPAATYVNSTGLKIWDGEKYRLFHHDIAGIGHDEASGLNQKIASSSNDPGLLTLSSNQSLANNAFLLWGHNGKALHEEEKPIGTPQMLQRKWLMVSSGNAGPISTDVVIDTRKLDVDASENTVYWLAIDRAGSGDFPLSETEYIKMAQLDRQGKAYFKGVVWNKDQHLQKEVMGIIAAQNLFFVTKVAPPRCAPPENGSLSLKIVGGTAPYKLTIVQNTNRNPFLRQTIDNNKSVTIPHVTTGKYHLFVSDALNQSYADSFYVNSLDAFPAVAIAPSYILPSEGYLKIDAAEKMPSDVRYLWSGPNDFSSVRSSIAIHQVGKYVLETTKNGCSNIQEIEVHAGFENIFNQYDVKVYPSPSSGVFTAKVSLSRPMPIRMDIYNADGQLLVSTKEEGRANYRFTSELTTTGVYRIQFTSGRYATTRSLIIIK